MTDHPITPPQELVQQWAHLPADWNTVALLIAQWGYDQRGEVNEAQLQKARDEELEACCDVLEDWGSCIIPDLRAARRPKPPSLKEQGLQAIEALLQRTTDPNIVEPLRLAVEALPDD